MQLQEEEGHWLGAWWQHAQRNLGTPGPLHPIVMDRRFLDGEEWWRVAQPGVRLVLAGSATMTGTRGAPKGWPSGNGDARRARMVRQGQGTTAREERLRTHGVGIEALTTSES